MNNTNQNLVQIIKFGFIGVANTLIDYLLFFLFFSVIGMDKNIAQVLATGIAMTNSYFCNRYWTFGKKGAVRFDEMWKFIVVNVLSLAATLLCLNLFYDVLRLDLVANQLMAILSIPFVLEGDNSVLFCKVVAIPFSLAVNFLGNKLWVFQKEG